MNYERLTLYVDCTRQVRQWIDQLRLNNDSAYDADKAEIHQAMLDVARDHEEEVIAKLNAGDGE